MEWSEYQRRYRIACTQLRVPPANTEILLAYAQEIHKKGFPVIFDSYHLSLLLGFSEELLYRISNSPERFYRKFSIPKHNGKRREIREPYPTLKEIQSWILVNILSKHRVSEYAKAYVKGRSVLDNARFHKNQSVVVKLDVKNFFGSVKQPRVVYSFMSMGYSKPLSVVLADLCCLNGALPQGAATSPYLSNVIAMNLDRSIGSYTRTRGYRYTRYSDDLTISGDMSDDDVGRVVGFVKHVLEREGLELQESKTKILRSNTQQYITGVVVNKKLSVQRTIKKMVRQEMYYIEKFGLDSHIAKKGITQRNYLNHLRGVVNWILNVEKRNQEFIRYKEALKTKNEV